MKLMDDRIKAALYATGIVVAVCAVIAFFLFAPTAFVAVFILVAGIGGLGYGLYWMCLDEIRRRNRSSNG